MNQIHPIYHCSSCTTLFETLSSGKDLKESSHELQLVSPKTNDVGQEKHVPVVTRTPSGIHIAIGSIPHPMEETHFIEWIEVLTQTRTYRVFLSPKDKPETDFPPIETPFVVREYCNIHGLWSVDIASL